MALVTDAGPLISLARVGRLDLLPALFGEVLIPPAAFQEVTHASDLPGARELSRAPWLRVVELRDHDRPDPSSSEGGLDGLQPQAGSAQLQQPHAEKGASMLPAVLARRAVVGLTLLSRSITIVVRRITEAPYYRGARYPALLPGTGT